MAKELLPDAFWARIAPLLPPEPPKPKGGRPRVSGRADDVRVVELSGLQRPGDLVSSEDDAGRKCFRADKLE
jgi:hypothetical protein